MKVGWPGASDDLKSANWVSLRRRELFLREEQTSQLRLAENIFSDKSESVAAEMQAMEEDSLRAQASLHLLNKLRAVLPLASAIRVPSLRESSKEAAPLEVCTTQSDIHSFFREKISLLAFSVHNIPSALALLQLETLQLPVASLEWLQRETAKQGLLLEFCAWRLSLPLEHRLTRATPSRATLKLFLDRCVADCVRLLTRMRARGRPKPHVDTLMKLFNGEQSRLQNNEQDEMNAQLAALGKITPEVFPEIHEWLAAKLQKRLRLLFD